MNKLCHGDRPLQQRHKTRQPRPSSTRLNERAGYAAREAVYSKVWTVRLSVFGDDNTAHCAPVNSARAQYSGRRGRAQLVETCKSIKL